MSRKAFFALLVLGALAGPGAAQTAEQNHAGHGAMADSEVAAPGAGSGTRPEPTMRRPWSGCMGR